MSTQVNEEETPIQKVVAFAPNRGKTPTHLVWYPALPSWLDVTHLALLLGTPGAHQGLDAGELRGSEAKL